ncbi:hypothetical protein RB620_07960 [Paenibacillus sp. LHD-117]|uniref:hypothetical protein n=1 Tax=Paenibacillus sp. LHD-117 TaxID=3071412 RepID=UPI0027E110EF|nr:hypothetical protein [Paenibacillus sp. LHD-117]MDQ6419364.1 hypothetical protein [Paenibacillus sp. LHD-117]
MMSRVVKLLALIALIAFLNIIVLSPGLIGAELSGGSAFASASVVTFVVMSLVTLLYGSHALIFRPGPPRRLPEPRTYESYWLALLRYRDLKIFPSEAAGALDQLERMENKKKALHGLLAQRFDRAELTFKKFVSVIAAVEELFYQHIRGILDQLDVQRSAGMKAGVIAQAAGYLGANEQILLKLDQLLSELSRLGSAEYRDAMNMPCMKDIDALISQTKYYKP